MNTGAFVADIVPQKERSRYLAYINVSGGLGFVLG